MIRLLYIFSFISIIACEQSSTRKADDKLLAEAYGKKLYLSDISNALAIKQGKQDSLNAIETIIDNWTWDQILYHEAQKIIGTNTEMDVLIEDYKRSLYINAFENNYLEAALDTSISQTEIDSFIKNHKEEFVLPETIIRYLYVKIPEQNDNDTIQSYWETEDLAGLRYYANVNDGITVLNLNKWHYLSELKNILPLSIFKKISLKKLNNYSITENEYKYYVKTIEIIDNKDDAPLSFLNQRVRHRILQQRIKQLLKNKKSELYNKKRKSKQIKIHAHSQN